MTSAVLLIYNSQTVLHEKTVIEIWNIITNTSNTKQLRNVNTRWWCQINVAISLKGKLTIEKTHAFCGKRVNFILTKDMSKSENESFLMFGLIQGKR
jgi:hypothetical protein